MAAILRLAGGLDRSHSQQVKDVLLPTSDNSAKEMELLVHADFNPEVDLWGARRRTKLFKRVFGIKLDVKWAEQPADDVSSHDKPKDRETQAGGLPPLELSTKTGDAVEHDRAAPKSPMALPTATAQQPAKSKPTATRQNLLAKRAS